MLSAKKPEPPRHPARFPVKIRQSTPAKGVIKPLEIIRTASGRNAEDASHDEEIFAGFACTEDNV